MIEFKCPRCQNTLQCHGQKAGSKLPCPSCGQRLQVPTPPPQLDQTIMGELGGANVTLMGEAPSNPASDIVRRPSVASPVAPLGEGESPKKPITGIVVSQNRPWWWLAVVIPISMLGPVVVVGAFCAGIMTLGQKASGTFTARQPTDTFTARSPTEDQARAQLRKVLSAWAAGKGAAAVSQEFSDIEFVDPLFSDRANIKGFDLERVVSYPGLREFDMYVRIVYLSVGGDEQSFSRTYEVFYPNDKGVWRIQVSANTPAAPGVARGWLNEAEARRRLTLALDAWVAQKWKAEMKRAYPWLDFTDLAYSDEVFLYRYDIGKVLGPLDRGMWKAEVYLVHRFQNKSEVRVQATYEIDSPDTQGVCHIRGYRP